MAISKERSPKATVGDSFATEQSALTIFKGQLPPKWIVRPHNPDFHLDYLVELTEEGELTGINFGVQLKGRTPKEKKLINLNYALKTKHLRYYREKCRFPVFVVLVDIQGKKSFWSFIQQYAESLSRQQLHTQKTVTVQFHLADNLDDISKFKQAVLDAAEYMQELRPGSINAAILQKKRELEAKDKRMSVQVSVIDGKQHIVINPKDKTPLTFKIKTQNPQTIAKFTDFLEKGTDLKVGGDEVEFAGTPLFDEIKLRNDGEVLIQHRNERDGHALFWWGGSGPDSQVYLPGKFYAGSKYLTFEGSWPTSPFQFSCAMGEATLTKGETFKAKFGFKPKEWEGQHVLHLAHFENFRALIKAIAEGKGVRLRLCVLGNTLGESKIDSKVLDDLTRMNVLVEFLHKARKLCDHFKISPLFPSVSKITKEDWDSVAELFGIMFEKEYRSPVSGVRLKIVASRTPSEQERRERGPLDIFQPEAAYKIFGELIQIGSLRTQITDIKLTKVTPKGNDGSAELVFEGTDKSEKIVKKGDIST